MDAATPHRRPSHPTGSPHSKRATIACDRCRKQKMRCFNNSDYRTPCVSCDERNIPCTYSPNRNIPQGNPTPLASRDPSRMGTSMNRIDTGRPVVPHAVTVTNYQEFPSTMPVSQAEGSNTSRTADIVYATSNVGQEATAESHNNLEENVNQVPQIPVEELFQEMDALNRENALRYPGMARRDN